MAKSRKPLGLNEPLRHPDHPRPRTRRELIAQGFRAGLGSVIGGSLLGLMSGNSYGQQFQSKLSQDIQNLKGNCNITNGAGKIPFICFDLAGGANIAGSNVLVGQRGGQMDFISTAGYSKQGLPGDRTPASSTTNFVNTDLGLAFHSESAMLRGILERAPMATPNVNGAVIPARSENDTGNNPHNPMYGINKAGADGSLVSLIGSRNSDSGGNSMAPASMIDLSVRPTKVDRPSDVTGLVDTGAEPTGPLSQGDNVKIIESIYRISDAKLNRVSTGIDPGNTGVLGGEALLDQMRCGYVKSADLADRFGDPASLNPQADPDIVDITNSGNAIFNQSEFDSDGEFRKTASVMKMVIDGLAGVGTVTMGGFDYHTGNREVGERRDLRAGRCIGACLEYAARKNVPLMIYVCSDGSVFSNGMTDDTADGAGKGVWTGDSQQTGCAFFLVYNPGGRATLLGATPDQQAMHQQLGFFRADGDVNTSSSPMSNNVNQLVEAVILNYMALHGEQGNFASLFPAHGLGDNTMRDSLTAFAPIVNGTI